MLRESSRDCNWALLNRVAQLLYCVAILLPELCQEHARTCVASIWLGLGKVTVLFVDPSKCHNLLGYIAACTSRCRRGVYCNRKHGFLTAVIDRRDRNSIN
jgi:hypothetical protein